MRSRPLQWAVKILVSGLLLFWLARRYGGDPALQAALRRLDLASFLLAEGIVAAGLVASALRWRLLLAARGVALPLGRAVRLYFAGYFFNLLLPTAVGGDIVRALGVGKQSGVAVVAGTILVERIIGFGCLLVVGLAASHQASELAVARPALWIAAAAYAAGRRGRARLPLEWAQRPGVSRWIAGLGRTAAQVRGTLPARTLFAAVVISFGWQFALVAANATLSAGLGGVAPAASLLAFVPVIQAIGMIPISVGGLGVREMGYEFFFRQAGYDGAGAVALAASYLAVTLAVALKGGLAYLLFPRRES